MLSLLARQQGGECSSQFGVLYWLREDTCDAGAGGPLGEQCAAVSGQQQHG
jgi:hypothetical protein